jgi:cell wall-associated NlpC family hydrolase
MSMKQFWIMLALFALPVAGHADETGMVEQGFAEQSLSVEVARTATVATASARNWPVQAEELILRAVAMLGVNYRYGGTSPEKGFDCSGFVRHVFGDALGIMLPRNAYAQSRAGQPISPTELRPGDLVFFNTLRRTFSHVGIYIGNNRFIHAPRSGQAIKIAQLSHPYWANRFNGARRVLAAGG